METIAKMTETSKSSRKKKEVKIFVVDDDPLYRQAMEYRLSQNPEYKIYSFETGEECFRHFDLLDPDIIILDYCLNETDSNAKNGLEVLRKLKSIKPEISILMLSGKESIEVAASSIRYGAFDYIVKNESAFVRLQNLINKILNNIHLEKWTKKQGNHLKVVGIMIPVIVVAPIVLNFFVPNLAPAITIALFVLLVLFFVIVHKLEKDEWTTLSENMRSNHSS